MGTMYWLRVTMMITILVVVIWSMQKLNSGKTVAVAPGGTEFSLCPTRITWVEAGGAHLEEHKTKWMMTVNSGPMREIDGAAAEKWFSILCSANLDVYEPPKGAAYSMSMKLGYVSGATADIARSAEGEFILSGHPFRSTGLEEALRTLPSLPEAQKPGQK